MKIFILTFALFLASCAPLKPLAPTSTTSSEAKSTPTAKQAIPQKSQKTQSITGINSWDRVLSPWLGTPYLSGGNSKKGTDCSGFVSSVYLEKEGMYVPRTTTEGFKMGKAVSKKDLVIGDLIFFGDNMKVSHVGIFVGKGNFIHASSSKGVIVSPLTDTYWEPRYIGARRYL